MNWKDGPIEGLVTRPLKRHSDPRGWLVEMFRSDETRDDTMPVMGYVSLTYPGVTRGPHEHREQTDSFAFVGPGSLEVAFWDKRDGSPTRGNRQVVVAGEERPLFVVVPPGVVHSYRNAGSQSAWVLNFPNRLYAGPGRKEDVDEIRYEDTNSETFPLK